MFRIGSVSFFLLLLTNLLYAANAVYNPCYQKNSQSIYTLSGVDCLAVESHTLVCHDPLLKIKAFPKGYESVSYDPFTRIHKVKTSQKVTSVKFKPLAKIADDTDLALISREGYRVGQIVSYANGFDRFGTFSLKNTLGKVLGAKCYTVVGIGTIDSRYIPSEFIQSFIAQNGAYYGDIGVRFEKKEGGYRVTDRDVYFRDNPFEVGDIILKLNGKRYPRFDAFSFAILFAPIGTVFDVTIKRNGTVRHVKVKSGRRYGGGYLTDTFLERFGLVFDTHLVVQQVIPGSYADCKGLKAGDRILQFDGVAVNTIQAMMNLISKKRVTHTSILFDRDDFQFFFTLP